MTTQFPYVQQSSETLRDLDGSDLSTRSVTRQYDDWGNLRQEDSAVNGGGAIFTAQTVTTYRNDSGAWLLGLPTRTSVAKMRDGSTITRTTDADYDGLGVRREKALFSAGAKPARQLSLRPEAIEAIVEETKRLKPSV